MNKIRCPFLGTLVSPRSSRFLACNVVRCSLGTRLRSLCCMQCYTIWLSVAFTTNANVCFRTSVAPVSSMRVTGHAPETFSVQTAETSCVGSARNRWDCVCALHVLLPESNKCEEVFVQSLACAVTSLVKISFYVVHTVGAPACWPLLWEVCSVETGQRSWSSGAWSCCSSQWQWNR